MNAEKYSLLKKILKAIGLSEERIDELISWIQTWLQDDSETKTGRVQYPFRLRDDFLSPAEQSFFRVLLEVTHDCALIAPKVSLGDLFYAQTGDYSQNRIYRNKIDRKHVDFLLYDRNTLRPILGIEMDDKSHQRKDRQERDRFVDGVFQAAGLPIAHIPARYNYSTEQLKLTLRDKIGLFAASDTSSSAAISEPGKKAPSCPNCGKEMVVRTAKSGRNAGNQFWGCTDFPNCRGILQLESEQPT